MKKLLYHLVGRVPRDGSLSSYIEQLHQKEYEKEWRYPFAKVISFLIRETTKID